MMGRATRMLTEQSPLDVVKEIGDALLATAAMIPLPHDPAALAQREAVATEGLARIEARDAELQTARNNILAQIEAEWPGLNAERELLAAELDAIKRAKAELQTEIDQRAIREQRLRAEIDVIAERVKNGEPLSVAARALRERLERAA